MIANYIEVTEKIRAISDRPADFRPLNKIVEENIERESSFCFMVMGYALYYAHMLIDHCYLKKHSKCGHNYSCQCKKELLQARGVDRPFIQSPIRGPVRLDGELISPSARDEETLI